MESNCGDSSNNRIRYALVVAIVAVIGFFILLARCRFGVDLTDDVWYTLDPCLVAKGATPYVNHWTQASGVSLPLFILYKVYLGLNGGTDGVFLFSRILYCFWKATVVAVTFILLKSGGLRIHPFLALPVICLGPHHQLFALNYNTIGLAYLFLAIAVVYVAMNTEGGQNQSKRCFVAFVGGIIMARCVIATPATIIGCLIVTLVIVFLHDWLVLRSIIVGGIFAASVVVLFCCMREGGENFILGIQYYFKDFNYYEGWQKCGVSFWDNTQYALNYMRPAICVFAFVIVADLLTKTRNDIFNKSLSLILAVSLMYAVYRLSKYRGGPFGDIIRVTKYGWFVPVAATFLRCDGANKKILKLICCISIAYVCVYLLQGYVSYYGLYTRSAWNFLSVVLGIQSVCICLSETYKKMNPWLLSATSVSVAMVVVIFLARGSYMYVYRDMPYPELTANVGAGLWKGCYTTPKRAMAIVELETTLKHKTNDNDQVFCWGRWPCFMTFMHKGNHCAPSPLGTGAQSGFDYWHLRKKVPNKIFVKFDDTDGFVPSKSPIWEFISKFYVQASAIYFPYTYSGLCNSSDHVGNGESSKILEFDIVDAPAALKYADSMATRVFEP